MRTLGRTNLAVTPGARRDGKPAPEWLARVEAVREQQMREIEAVLA